MRAQGTSLRTYLLTRLALAIPTVLILLTMVFMLMRVAPGNPIQAALGGHVSQAEIERRSAAAGYDRPILTQYFEYPELPVPVKARYRGFHRFDLTTCIGCDKCARACPVSRLAATTASPGSRMFSRPRPRPSSITWPSSARIRFT